MKLHDRVRYAARAKHFSYRTEQAYVFWCERFIRFLPRDVPIRREGLAEPVTLWRRGAGLKSPIRPRDAVRSEVYASRLTATRSPRSGAGSLARLRVS